MQLVLTLLVRDEQDILEDNLRYHLSRGVDRILVTDNLSVDRTPDILRRYERLGWVTVLRAEDDTYDQARWVSRMARMAFDQHRADWVIHADADEFWWPERGDLKSALALVPAAYPALVVPRHNFVVRRSQRAPSVRDMLLREEASVSYLGRPLLPKVCHRGRADVFVEQGNHGVLEASTGKALSAWSGYAPIRILHYQMRGWPHFRNKIEKGGAAYARNTELAQQVGRGWRLLYEMHAAGRLRAYYDEQLLSDEQCLAGLAQGRLVRDSRLADWLAALPADFPTAREAEGGA